MESLDKTYIPHQRKVHTELRTEEPQDSSNIQGEEAFNFYSDDDDDGEEIKLDAGAYAHKGLPEFAKALSSANDVIIMTQSS